MNGITKKFAALTAEQSKALAEQLNSAYDKPPAADNETGKKDEDQKNDKE